MDRASAHLLGDGVGAVQSIGVRQLPLVQLHVLQSLSIDGYASVLFDVHGDVEDSYLAGVSWTF